MAIKPSVTALLLLTAQATAFSSNSPSWRNTAAFALEPRSSCLGIELTFYEGTTCQGSGTIACTIPPCAEASSTDAPEKWQSFIYNGVKGTCSPDAMLYVFPEQSSSSAWSLSALTEGHCWQAASGSDYVKDVAFLAAGDCPNNCVIAFGAISPQGVTCTLDDKGGCSSNAGCENGTGLCLKKHKK